MRVALIDPSHWHYAMYRDGLAGADVEIVGVTDPSEAIAGRIAAEHGCRAWSDTGSMLDGVKPDFAFAFGAHAHMPGIAEQLVTRRIPFSIEKPCGLTSADVAQVRRSAEARGVFASVPFHYRLSGLAQTLSSLVSLPSHDFLGATFRINAGSPLRYAGSSPWLTDPALAGGGCMMNLAHHPIDLLRQLTGGEVVEVSAHASNKLLGLAVEDQAFLSLTFSDGTVAAIETGYTHAVGADSYMDFDVSFSHRRFCAERRQDALRVREREGGGARDVPTDWMFKTYFADYARRTLELAVSGRPPVAGLADLEQTMRVVEAGYASLRERTVIQLRPSH